jgi:hypothetical protein
VSAPLADRLLSAAAALTFCAALVAAEKRPGPRAPGLWASAVRYQLTVDRAGTRPLAEGGVELTTAHGDLVQVTRAFTVQGSATLVDCTGAGGDVWDRREAGLAAPFERLGGLLIGAAFAGHGGAVDPSAVVRPQLVDLLGGPIDYGAARFADARYCRVHFLVNGPYERGALPGLPAGIEPIRLTLHLEGRYRVAGQGAAWRSFTAHATAADGALFDLPAVLAETRPARLAPEGGAHVLVQVQRPLAGLFDGLDLQAQPPSLGRAVLERLDRQTRVRVSVEEPPLQAAQ